MRFVEIELARGGRRRVNPDQVAYLVGNEDDTATTLVFTGFAGGLLELLVKGAEAQVAAALEEARKPWVGVDWGKEPAYASGCVSSGPGHAMFVGAAQGKSTPWARLLAATEPAPKPGFETICRGGAYGDLVYRQVPRDQVREMLAKDRPPSKRAQRRAAGKAAQTPKGKS